MVNVGLIGLGKMGLSHLAIASAHPEVQMKGVCDSAAYVRGVLERYTQIPVFSDYNRLFNEADLDAVIIATPSRLHGPMVRAALDRNLNVFCEKPLCLDVSEGMQLAEQAQRKGVVNQVGYHYRFVSCFKEAKRLISSGAFGRIHHIRVEAYGPVVLRPKGATWRGARGEGGGCLYDYACHAIDIANFLVGPPKAVGGTVLNKIFSKDVEDEVHATLYFDGELTGEIAANWSDDSHRRMWVQVNVWGTNGRMIVDRQELKTYIRRATDDSNAALKPGWNIRYATDFPEPVWYYLRGEEYSSQIDYFIRCILAGRQDNVSSFASAVETDVALSMMLQDGGRPARTAAVGQDGRARAQRPWLHLFAKA